MEASAPSAASRAAPSSSAADSLAFSPAAAAEALLARDKDATQDPYNTQRAAAQGLVTIAVFVCKLARNMSERAEAVLLQGDLHFHQIIQQKLHTKLHPRLHLVHPVTSKPPPVAESTSD